MKELKNFQKKYLKAMAHHLKPVVFVGQKGITENLVNSIQDAFERHELIKIKFIDFKEKESKEKIIQSIVEDTDSYFVGMVGHTATLYRQSFNKKNQTIYLPESWEKRD